jgi:hypothetical protein
MKTDYRCVKSYSPDAIERVREKFLIEVDKDPTQFEVEDIELVQTDEWTVCRFLFIHQNVEEAAAKNLIEAMKWRKDKGFLRTSFSFFPNEYFRLGVLFPYESDIDGNPVIYCRGKFLKTIPELKEVSEDFTSLNFYRVDRMSEGRGWTFIIDTEGAGLHNADLNMLQYLVSTLKQYFPGGLNHLLVIDCPWILKAFWSLVKNWIPSHRRDMIKFVSRKDLPKFVPKENIPDFLGGTCSRKYKGWSVVPKGCPSGVQFVQKLCPDDDAEEIFDRLFNEYRAFIEEDGDEPTDLIEDTPVIPVN